MAMTFLAMWLEEPDLAHTNFLIMIFIGLVAVAMAVMAIALIVVAVTASKAMKGLTATVDELKEKVLPLVATVTEIGKTSQALLHDSAPKVKHITDNLKTASDMLVETSNAARSAVRQFDTTVTDANQRAQRQVARVDGMVTATLTAAVEVAETIAHGIQVPVQKIAVLATQAKLLGEGLLAKIKSMAARSPFGSQ